MMTGAEWVRSHEVEGHSLAMEVYEVDVRKVSASEDNEGFVRIASWKSYDTIIDKIVVVCHDCDTEMEVLDREVDWI